MMKSNMKKQMSSAPQMSMRPKKRPMRDEESAAPKKSMRPKARPEMIGNTPGSQGTRGIDPMENYGPEGVKRLTGGMKSGGKVKKAYKSGGKVRGYGMARGGKVCKMR